MTAHDTSGNRRMVSFRIRRKMIQELDDLVKKIKKETKGAYSKSAVFEMAIVNASYCNTTDIVNRYIESFKVTE